MCIIIENQTGRPIDSTTIDIAVTNNPDGFGFLDLSSMELFKTLDMKQATELLRNNGNYVAHCRYATKGKVKKSNVHPFKLADGSLLFHNGTIGSFNGTANDSSKVATVLDMIPRRSHRKKFLSMLDSRFLLVQPDGKVIRTGDWHNINGVHYSKKPKRGIGFGWTGRQDWSSYAWDDRTDGGDSEWKDDYWQLEGNNHLIAVYGTLKFGRGNNSFLHGASFVADGETLDKYRLCIQGLPYLLDGVDEHCGHNVSVEVYEVDSETLHHIDGLEGHPDFYEREQITIQTTDGQLLECWVYFVDSGPEYDNGTYHRTF